MLPFKSKAAVAAAAENSTSYNSNVSLSTTHTPNEPRLMRYFNAGGVAESSNTHARQSELNSIVSGRRTDMLGLKKSSRTLTAAQLVDWLKRSNIKYIAADFDLTMLTVHSGGWVDTLEADAEEILNKLSPSFIELAQEAERKDVPICTVTFSDTKSIPSAAQSTGLAGESLVSAVLKRANNPFKIQKVYGHYPTHYQSPSEYSRLGLHQPMSNDKNYHLLQLCHDFQIQPSEVILIDDSLINCLKAAALGFLTLRVGGRRGFTFDTLQPVTISTKAVVQRLGQFEQD